MQSFYLIILCFFLNIDIILSFYQKYQKYDIKFTKQKFFVDLQSNNLNNYNNTITNDFSSTYSYFERLLFHRFAISVVTEINSSNTDTNKHISIPKTYNELIAIIQSMVYTNIKNPNFINQKSRNMLVKLFPSWLLPAFIQLFAKPFPSFSAWMNTYVTHFATRWLMGKSTIYSIEQYQNNKNLILREQGLFIEKCKFLETSGCLQTCVHACKIPTQQFFLENMGVPVILRPNVTDLSCKFEFGIKPPSDIKDDEVFNEICLKSCFRNKTNVQCLS